MQSKAAEILMLRIEALEGRLETDLQCTVENSSQKFEAVTPSGIRVEGTS
jgi:hypothetical protein